MLPVKRPPSSVRGRVPPGCQPVALGRFDLLNWCSGGARGEGEGGESMWTRLEDHKKEYNNMLLTWRYTPDSA